MDSAKKTGSFPFLKDQLYNYREFPAPRELAAYVSCVWVVTPKQAVSNQLELTRRILPDGCIDLVITRDEPGLCRIQGAVQTSLDSTNFLGLQTKFIHLMPSMGSRSWWAIRFKPHAIPLLFNISSASLIDQIAEGSSVSTRIMRSLEDLVLGSSSDQETAGKLYQWLYSQLRKEVREVRCVNWAISCLVESQGAIPISKLSSGLGVSRQHLARLFKTYVGISPKKYGRIIRFSSAIKSIENGKFKGWQNLTYSHEYYDQSHMIADFIEFSGLSPAAISEARFETFHFSNTAGIRRC